MEDSNQGVSGRVTEEDWENAHQMPVNEEMNERLVRAVDSGTAIWNFQGPGLPEQGVPMPVFMVEFQTQRELPTGDKEHDIQQFFLPPSVFASLMGELTNHLWRLWGASPTPMVAQDDIEQFLKNIRGNGNGNGNGDGGHDDGMGGGYL